MTSGEGDDSEQVLRSLGREMMRMSGRRTTSYHRAELEASAFRILWILEETGPLTLRDLADGLQLERSTVARQVGAAVDQGFVEHVEGTGRSGRLVRPTAAGRRAYRHDGELRRVVYAEALDELGPERAAAMVESLRDFNDALDRAHEDDLEG